MVSVSIYSKKQGELSNFLSHFYNTNFNLENISNWKKNYANPIELAEIIGVFIDNFEDYSNLKMWVCLDKGIFVHISKENANDIIKYLYERFPY